MKERLSFNESKFRNNKNSFVGLTLDGKYLVIEKIGGARQGEIYKAIDITSQKKKWFTLKISFISRLKNEQLDKKVLAKKLNYILEQDRILKKFSHPNILRWHNTYSNEELKIIVTQYCNQGTLEDMIIKHNAFQLNHAIHVMKQIIQALKVLHANQIIHRDLKPSNIFVHNGRYIVGDFGISKIYNSAYNNDSYIQAPEVKNGEYGLNADIYSLGVILYIMLCPIGSIPERGLEAQKMRFKENTRPKMKNGNQFPNEVMEFLKKSLQKDPKSRMDWRDLQENCLLRMEENQQLPNQLTQEIQLTEFSPRLTQIKATFLQMNEEKNEEIQNPQQLEITEMDEQEFQGRKILYSSIITVEEDQKYLQVQSVLIRCKIAEFIYKEVIRKIQQHADFKKNLRDHKEWVTLMYKLSSTAFVYLSKSRSILGKKDMVSSKFTKELDTKIERLYMKCKERMESYGKRLYHLETGIFSFLKSKVQKLFDYQHFKERVLQLEGILDYDFERKQNNEFMKNCAVEIKNKYKLMSNQEFIRIEKNIIILHQFEKIKPDHLREKPIYDIFKDELAKL